MSETRALTVGAESAGMRLDSFLAGALPELSRTRAKALVLGGQVSIDDVPVLEPKRPVSAGEAISVAVPPPEPAEPQAEPIPLDIVYEDGDIIVVNKPAGLVVHPGAGNWTGTLVNALIAHCGDSLSGIGGVRRPGIVHRLDKDTSGLIVVAKTDQAHRGLSAQFADHGREGALKREYDALVWGVPSPHIGQVGAPLKRDERNRQKQAVARSGGRPAVTHYAVKETFADRAALLTCRLETGRTHQIRVHMAHIGHPVVADAVYGAGFQTKADTLPDPLKTAVKAFGHQALHARLLGFRHPISGESLQFEVDWPAKLMKLVELFRELNV